MLNLQQRINILTHLHKYIISEPSLWLDTKIKASESNPWFIPDFIDSAVRHITYEFIEPAKLRAWVSQYNITEQKHQPVNIGITMAGNIPLVGFHDFLCAFICGHKQTIKRSSKDNILLKHFVEKMVSWDAVVSEYIVFSDLLKGCDAYIATGSDNTARYFEFYFRKYPHIIRKNRTSIAVLDGNEDENDLKKLADDVYLYFGLGCRNVTKIYVPAGYDFLPLLTAFKKYDRLIENHKYKHNYDFNLTMHLMNQTVYMTNGSIILSEKKSVFSPISQLHYEFYDDPKEINAALHPDQIQCIIGNGKTSFGTAQFPTLSDYADGTDTMKFLTQLNSQ